MSFNILVRMSLLGTAFLDFELLISFAIISFVTGFYKKLIVWISIVFSCNYTTMNLLAACSTISEMSLF